MKLKKDIIKNELKFKKPSQPKSYREALPQISLAQLITNNILLRSKDIKRPLYILEDKEEEEIDPISAV
jgi:hypothetical protein